MKTSPVLKLADDFGWGINTNLQQYKINELLPLVEGNNILDIGCGPGYFVDALTQKGFNATGIDIESKFIKFAKNNLSGNFLFANALKLPFKDKQFNTVFIRNVLEHIDNDLLAIKEALRVGNRVVVIVPHKTPDNLTKRGVHFIHYQDHSHLRNYTHKSLSELINTAEAEIIKLSYTERLPAKSLFVELFQAPAIIKRIIAKLFFIIFKEADYHEEILAIIKSC